MLVPEKTCKTIRELSIEDAVSSMGNVSANISPQITSVKNMSMNSKQAGSIISNSRRMRRRQSENPPATQNVASIMKPSNTLVGIIRQQSIPFAKSPADNDGSSIQQVGMIEKQLSMTRSEVVKSELVSGQAAENRRF